MEIIAKLLYFAFLTSDWLTDWWQRSGRRRSSARTNENNNKQHSRWIAFTRRSAEQRFSHVFSHSQRTTANCQNVLNRGIDNTTAVPFEMRSFDLHSDFRMNSICWCDFVATSCWLSTENLFYPHENLIERKSSPKWISVRAMESWYRPHLSCPYVIHLTKLLYARLWSVQYSRTLALALCRIAAFDIVVRSHICAIDSGRKRLDARGNPIYEWIAHSRIFFDQVVCWMLLEKRNAISTPFLIAHSSGMSSWLYHLFDTPKRCETFYLSSSTFQHRRINASHGWFLFFCFCYYSPVPSVTARHFNEITVWCYLSQSNYAKIMNVFFFLLWPGHSKKKTSLKFTSNYIVFHEYTIHIATVVFLGFTIQSINGKFCSFDSILRIFARVFFRIQKWFC